MRTLFTRIFAIVAAMLLCVILLVGYIWMRPQQVITTRNLERLATLADRIGYDITWDTAAIEATSLGLWRKQLTLQLQHLCMAPTLVGPALGISGCIDTIDIDVTLQLRHGRVTISRLARAVVSGAQLQWRQAAVAPAVADAPAPSLPPMPTLQLPALFRDTTFGVLRFDDLHLNVAQGAQQWALTGALVGAVSDDDALEHLQLDVALHQDDRSTAALHVTLRSPSHFRRNDWHLSSTADWHHTDATHAALQLTAQPHFTGGLLLTLHSTAQQQSQQMELAATGWLRTTRLAVQLRGSAHSSAPGFPRIAMDACTIGLQQSTALPSRGQLDINCPLRVSTPRHTLTRPVLGQRQVASETLVFTALAQLDVPFMPHADGEYTGTLSLQLHPLQKALVQGNGALTAQLTGHPFRQQHPDPIIITSNAELRIPNFATVVQQLRHTAWAVPAPFNVLDGSVVFGLDGSLRWPEQRGTMAFRLTSRLASPQERLHLDAHGEVQVAQLRPQGTRRTVQLQLTDVQLMLPRLDVTNLPRLVPDARIRRRTTKSVTTSTATPFDIDVQIVTPPTSPIRIVAEHAQTPIPIAVDLSFRDGHLGGTLTVQTFDAQIFRRSATIERLAVVVRNPTGNSTIEGSIRVPYADYTITIRVIGTADRPRMLMESTPYLSQEEILSVLLFGKPLAQLDGDNAASVGDMRSAMSQRAVSLLSMYLLASTPIESVGYDPQTGIFSAKVRLPGGVALNIGATANAINQVGLRRKVWKNIYINTSVVEPADATKRTVDTYLEWSKRY